MPDTVAADHACGGFVVYPPDHPEYDPELDRPDPLAPDGMPPGEWLVPPDEADRYCVGLAHWVGDRPLSEAELAALLARSEAAAGTPVEG